jgi:hypothetical protein
MKRPILAAAMLAAVTIGASHEAVAQRGYRGYYGDGLIGGLSANVIVGGYYGYYPGYVGYVGYPGYVRYPGQIAYAAPSYPPPGCVIRQQRVWNGQAWRLRKIRVCY